MPDKVVKKKKAISAVFEVENWLYRKETKEKPLEVRAAIYWGALGVAHSCDEISWDRQRELFGEYMSKALGLR